MARRQKLRGAIEKPPAQFPTVIKPHGYDESGLKTCLHCGQGKNNRLHIQPHVYSINYDSKLERCLCGLSRFHALHPSEMK